jgi:secondary thiamine-phosphate synthase enzyme
MDVISVNSTARNQMIDVTALVRAAAKKSGVKSGVCMLFVPHTTAAVTINENADRDVVRDVLAGLEKFVPADGGYAHSEGNSDAHIKSSLVGCQLSIFVEKGDLVLGTWQGVYFCEFDGPRNRKVYVKVVSDPSST